MHLRTKLFFSFFFFAWVVGGPPGVVSWLTFGISTLTGPSGWIFEPACAWWTAENSSKAISPSILYIFPEWHIMCACVCLCVLLYWSVFCIHRQLEGPNFEQFTATDLLQLENLLNDTLTEIRAVKVRIIVLLQLKSRVSKNNRNMVMRLHIDYQEDNVHVSLMPFAACSYILVLLYSDLFKRLWYYKFLVPCLIVLKFNQANKYTNNLQLPSILVADFHMFT